ncbi:MAG: hypothetical protein HY617_03350 [Candidatus Sungbacteria bacterium]|nr:hypothetical protein [Candidatus Sungbacteria bacterium]
MLKIHDAVREILYDDEEALYALSHGYMNLSAYAKQIERAVEQKTKKRVGAAGIVVALSRIKKDIKKSDPLIQEIRINNITTKSPLSEIVFEKTPQLLAKLSALYEKVKTGHDDFLAMTLSTSEITVICSDRIKESILKHFKETPRMIESRLASIGLSLDPKYYRMPNITFSLIRQIARKRIILAETITTYTEIIFVFHEKSLPEMIMLFRA